MQSVDNWLVDLNLILMKKKKTNYNTCCDEKKVLIIIYNNKWVLPLKFWMCTNFYLIFFSDVKSIYTRSLEPIKKAAKYISNSNYSDKCQKKKIIKIWLTIF